uniref:Phorbol-ester/DAG-type domain-containing protein n=1 Tax=Arcella intermedia TaxID=1963864 RepID=A0A6B2L066_9EUKA
MCYPFWYLFNEETENLLTAIKSGKVEYPDHFWQQINPDAKDFVCKLLKVDPEERLSALEALRHPWLKPVTQGFVETASNTLANSPSDSTLPEIECPDKDETDDTTDEEDSDEEAAISPKSDTNEALPSQTNLSAFCKRLLKSTPAKQKVKDHNLEHPLISEKFLDAEFVPTGTAFGTLSSVYAKTDEAPETEVTEEKPITEQVNTETPELGDSKKQTKQLPRKLYRHQWRKITGTFCSECENFIYGLSDKHGYKCKNCKLVVHRDCRQNAPVNCLRSKRRRQAVERANEDSFNGGHSPRKQLKSKTAKGKDPEVSPKERKSRRESKVRTSPSKYAEKESTEPRTSRPVRSRGDTLDLLDVKGSKYNYRDSPFLPSFTREYDVAPKTKSQKFRRASNGASKEEMGKFHSPRQRKSSFGSKESLDRILNSARRMARSKEDPSPNEVKRKPSVGNFPSPRRTSHSKTTNDASTQEHGQPQRKTSDKAKQHTSFSPRSSKKASRTTEKADVPSPVAMTFSSPDLPSLNLKEEGNKTPHNLRGNGLHHSGNSLHHSGNSLHHSSHHNSHHSSHHSAHHPDHNHLRVMETHPESSSSRRHEGTPHNNKKETLEIVD